MKIQEIDKYTIQNKTYKIKRKIKIQIVVNL